MITDCYAGSWWRLPHNGDWDICNVYVTNTGHMHLIISRTRYMLSRPTKQEDLVIQGGFALLVHTKFKYIHDGYAFLCRQPITQFSL